ncbi:hypothetical protein ACFW3D_40380 [Streptomyces sp. NPDC058864]
MSYVATTLASAETPAEHLQLAVFTTMAAAFFIWTGRRQRRTGRSVIAPNETMRTVDTLVPPWPPSRGNRLAGCFWIGLGGVFTLPAIFNFVAAAYKFFG